MRLPFTPEEFLDVFVRYNDAVWPAPLLLVALAVGAVAYGSRDWPGDGRRVNAILAVLWVWSAIGYHLAFFANLSRAAIVFAIAFAVQGGLFASLAIGPRVLAYRPRANAAGIVGSILIAYALIGYPVVSYLVGHRYPAAPTFGVPCPTTIFTFGLLLWSSGPLARRLALAVVPTLWAIVATSAAVNLSMTEDFGLLMAALVAVPLILRARRYSLPAARGASTSPSPSARSNVAL